MSGMRDNHLARQWNRCLRDQRGSVAIIFALTICVLCGSIALGLDYARALAVRSQLQASVDAAALGASPNGQKNDPQMAARVTDNFTYNNQNQKFGAVAINVESEPIPQGVRVTATADVPTSFGRILGITTMPVAVTAEAISAKNGFEIALVLDTTYSMTGQKLADLQSAAKSLIDEVVAASASGSVKFSLVPFSNYVNVGMGNRHANWMSVPNDSIETITYQSYQTRDCVGPTIPVPNTCYNDGVPSDCSSQQCSAYGPTYTVPGGSYTVPHTWNGCAGSRLSAPDLTVSASFSSPIPGIRDVGCPSPLARLTDDASSIKNQIDGMVAQGETYISAGMMWGWRTLSPQPPFADGQPPNSNPPTRKTMILMTDGWNTRSQDQTAHEGTDAVASDAAMTQLCTLIKSENIEVYAIAFEVTNQSMLTRLRNCATDNDHFFDATDGQALQKAFSQISGSLVKLALSK